MWDIIGIPCKYVIVAIYSKREQPEAYVYQYFRKTTYLDVYKHSVQPVPSQEAWETTELPDIHQWIVKKPPSRPRRKRIKNPEE